MTHRVEIKNGKFVGWMKTKDAAKKLGVSVDSVRRMIRDRRFCAKDVMKFERSYYIREKAVDAMIKKLAKRNKK